METNHDLIEEKIKLIAHYVLGGNLAEGTAELKKILRRRIPRKFLADIADLARLALDRNTALRLLHPYIHPPRGTLTKATDHEKTVYAMALTEITAFSEAGALLKNIDANKLPQAAFARALNHIRQWEWDAAIPHLQQMIDSKSTKMVEPFLIWLGGAYLHGPGNFQRSRIVLEQGLKGASEKNYNLAQVHGLRFLIETYFMLRDWKHATQAVERYEKAGKGRTEVHKHLAKMWRVLISAANPSDQSHSIDELAEVRVELMKHGDWEGARRSDLFRGLYTRNLELLTHVYFGTPYPLMRTKITKLLGGEDKLPQSYVWMPQGGAEMKWKLNVHTGENSVSKARLKMGQDPQKLLEFLCNDFYGHKRLPQIHEALHPGEYFNLDTSPDRVHQTMRRLRDWLAENRIPLSIREKDGFYFLDAREGLGLEIYRNPEATLAEKPKPLTKKTAKAIEALRKHFRKKAFSAQEAASALDVSYRSAVGYLKESTEKGLTARKGSGPTITYVFV